MGGGISSFLSLFRGEDPVRYPDIFCPVGGVQSTRGPGRYRTTVLTYKEAASSIVVLDFFICDGH